MSDDTITSLDLDSLNGAQIEAVVEAIRQSFDDDQLGMLLRQSLDKKLDDLAEPGPWPVRVFTVVEESQKQGFGRRLIEAVEAARPEAERVKRLRPRLATLQRTAQVIKREAPAPDRPADESPQRQAAPEATTSKVAAIPGTRATASASHSWWKITAAVVALMALIAAAWAYRQKTYWDEQAAAYDAAAQKADLLAWDEYLALPPDPYYAEKAEAEKVRLIPLKQAESESAFAKTREAGAVSDWLTFLTAFQSYAKYISADRLAFAERMINECGDFDSSGPMTMGPEAARWCTSPGATLTIKQQAFKGNCSDYLAAFGDVHQNILGRRAISKAKEGDNAGAIKDIEACQCHNVPVQQQILQLAESQRMICWLRIQPRPSN